MTESMRLVGEEDAIGSGKLDEWKRNWKVVLAAAIGIALATTPIYSIGVMLIPLEKEFGWSRTEITAGKLITSIVGIFAGPIIGLVVDKFGARRLAIFSAIMVCLSLSSFATTSDNVWSWWLRWSALSLLGLGITMTIWMTAISSLFSNSRGMALAVALSGTGIGSSATPLLCQYLIETVGWRNGYLLLGIFWFVASVPPIVCWFTSAKDRNRASIQRGEVKVQEAVLSGITVSQALRSSTYYLLSLGAFLTATTAMGIAVNLVPILAASEITTIIAAGIAGTLGISSISGRLFSGFLMDRVDGRFVAAVSAILPLVGCLLLIFFPGSVTFATFAAILFGLALGAELDAVGYLASRHLGMRNFGVLFGLISGLLALGTGLGPVMASYAYDVTASYEIALYGFMFACVISSIAFLLLGPYPDFPAIKDSKT